ncbi:MAG: hypothetical protein ACREJO_13580 [Phycisphaerales bacterium]
MSDGREQLDRLRLVARKWAFGGGVALVAIAVWAFWSGVSPAVEVVQLRTTAKGSAAAKTSTVDLAAFNAPIWNPTPPPKPVPPPPPLRLQLIAISAEVVPNGPSRFRAAVYDPDTDTLHQVVTGDQLVGRRVTRVAANELEISEGQGTRRLLLDTAASGGTP